MDDQTTITELRQAVHKFVEDRNWAGYHTPKKYDTTYPTELESVRSELCLTGI